MSYGRAIRLLGAAGGHDRFAEGLITFHPDKLAADVWGFLGTETRVLAWTEVYQSISSGIVQAVNSPIALVECKSSDDAVAPALKYLKARFPEAAAWQVSATGSRDYLSAEGIRVAPARVLLSQLV